MLSRDDLTLAEVCEALQTREKMKGMVQTGDFVRVGNDNKCHIVGVGSVQIKTHNGMTRTLTGVKHIPSMARNLISLSTLDYDGYKYARGINARRYQKVLLLL